MSQVFGVCISVFVALLCNLLFQNSGHIIWLSLLSPDWIFLVYLFWGMRVAGLWLVWNSWGVGCLYSIVLDDTLGFYSFVYAGAVLIVQNARFRLLVVSKVEQGIFISLLMMMYLIISDITFRLDGNGLQLPIVIAFFGHVFGLWCVNLCLLPLYPVSRETDLFSKS